MHAIQSLHRTGADGSLTLTLPLGQPNAEFEVLVVVQPQTTESETPVDKTQDPWASINAFRERLAASGRTFSDSVELIREDRDR